MTNNETGTDHSLGKRELPFSEDTFKRRIAFASMFFSGMFLERLMSEEEEVTTKDGRKITIRHSLFDEIFNWPEAEEKHTRPPKEETEPGIVVEPHDTEMKETQRPLRRPPRKKKKQQSQIRSANVYSTQKWPRY